VASWAGLTPKHRESDLVVRCGRVTTQGDDLMISDSAAMMT
jgi:hypothetical protein